MTKKMILFDMDGVLLKPGGYHQALKATVNRIGVALGFPAVDLTDDQTAHFEALSITNEWDSLAISTALMLIKAWEFDPNLRLDGYRVNEIKLDAQLPAIDAFLGSFTNVGDLPSQSAYAKITDENAWLNQSQKDHLKEILFNTRDIYKSLTLPWHQETVLGSQVFQSTYGLEPKLDTESYLQVYDRPVLTPEKRKKFEEWLADDRHCAGILTNRPSQTPPGYLSSPEAELGAALVEMEHLPLLGSGLLAWFAATQCGLPDHSLFKPNPVHTLALMQLCGGLPAEDALRKAYDLWQGEGNSGDWVKFDASKVIVFEDSVKGLQSVRSAQALLAGEDINIDAILFGVSNNAIKKAELQKIADTVYTDINQVNWEEL
jgi:hypothetical protein